jgi:hypothetical protein
MPPHNVRGGANDCKRHTAAGRLLELRLRVCRLMIYSELANRFWVLGRISRIVFSFPEVAGLEKLMRIQHALATACCCWVAAEAVPLGGRSVSLEGGGIARGAARTRSPATALSSDTADLALPEMFLATVDIATWPTAAPSPADALNASFRLIYDGTAPGYHLSSTSPGVRLEVSQSDALLAVDEFPELIKTWGIGCRVVPSPWEGWWGFLQVTRPRVPALLVPSLRRWRRAPLRSSRCLYMLSSCRRLDRARGTTWVSSPALGRPLAAYVSATRTHPPVPCLTRCVSGRLLTGPQAMWCR